jgi:hypothetical protein
MTPLTIEQKARLGREKARRAGVEREAAASGTAVAPTTKILPGTKLSAARLTGRTIALWPKFRGRIYSGRADGAVCLGCRVWMVDQDPGGFSVRGPRSLDLWQKELITLDLHTWHVGTIRKRGNAFYFEHSAVAVTKRVRALLPARGY